MLWVPSHLRPILNALSVQLDLLVHLQAQLSQLSAPMEATRLVARPLACAVQLDLPVQTKLLRPKRHVLLAAIPKVVKVAAHLVLRACSASV